MSTCDINIIRYKPSDDEMARAADRVRDALAPWPSSPNDAREAADAIRNLLFLREVELDPSSYPCLSGTNTSARP